MLVGEAGVGKTRLAGEIAGHAAELGVRVLWGRCRENGGSPPYWPWVQMFRAYADVVDPDTLLRHLGEGASHLIQAIPDLAPVLPGPHSSASLEWDHARFAAFDTAAAFLERASQETPLMLVFDDLHAGDLSSLEMLEFVAGEPRDRRLLILGTSREHEPKAPEIARGLIDLGRLGQRIPLSGLSEDDLARFVEQIHGGPAPPPVVAVIQSLTEGNPLFARELVRLLRAGGPLDRPALLDRVRLPHGVRQTIRRRIEPLPEATKELLAVAAVVGRSFNVAVLAGVTGHSPGQLLARLGSAVASMIVEAVPRAPGGYVFSHALFRETLYEDLPPQRRIELHHRTGEALECLHEGNLGPHLAEIAHHCFEALSYDPGRALDYCERAGEWAADGLAYEEAARDYERALHALDLKGADGARRCELLIGLGEAQRKSGRPQEAIANLERAVDQARKGGYMELLTRAAFAYEGARWQFDGRWEIGPASAPLLKRTLHDLPPGDYAGRALVLGRLVRAEHATAPADETVRLAREAVALAERSAAPDARATALEGLWWALWTRSTEGYLKEGLTIAAAIRHIGEETANPELALRGQLFVLDGLCELGDMPGLDRGVEDYARLADELKQPWYVWWTAAYRAGRALREGRFDECERLANETLQAGRRVGAITAGRAGVLMLLLRAEQGRFEEMREIAAAAVADFPVVASYYRAVLVLADAQSGHEARARAELERLAANDFMDIPRSLIWLGTMATLADACCCLRDERHAATIYEILSPYPRRIATVRGAHAYWRCTSDFLGRLAAQLGRSGVASRHFDDALAMHRRMGAPPWLARTRFHYARMLLEQGGERGDPERARKMLGQAVDTARELGMDALARDAAALLGAQARDGGPLLPSAGDASVFRKEGEYWAISFDSDSFRLKDTKGLGYIRALLAHPNKELHVIDLLVTPNGEAGVTRGEAIEVGLSAVRAEDSGEVLDHRAKTAYRRRLEELMGELEDADAAGDKERAACFREEIEFLTAELAGALGLSGRDRRAASAAERARVNVTRAIRSAIRRIAGHSPILGRHLEVSVRTGAFCCYAPDPRASVRWEL